MVFTWRVSRRRNVAPAGWRALAARLLGAAAAAVYDGPADLLASLPDSILGRRG